MGLYERGYKYVCLYSRHGRHKRLGKFKSYLNLINWYQKHWEGNNIDTSKLFIKRTKS